MAKNMTNRLKFNIGEIVHYEDVPSFSFPKYNDDWFIEKKVQDCMLL